MKEQIIYEAVDALVGEPLTKERAREILTNAFTDKIMIVWTVEDVQTHATNMGYTISYDQAHEILHHLANNHDADLGISWETIKAAINSYING